MVESGFFTNTERMKEACLGLLLFSDEDGQIHHDNECGARGKLGNTGYNNDSYPYLNAMITLYRFLHQSALDRMKSNAHEHEKNERGRLVSHRARLELSSARL